MGTKIKINKGLNPYVELRQNLTNRVTADGATYEGDQSLIDLSNEIFVAGDGLFITPHAYDVDKLYAALPKNGTGDGTHVRASTGTRVNENGLIEEIAIDTPRIDWSDGEPAILCEPEGENMILGSDQLSNGLLTGILNETDVSEPLTVEGNRARRLTRETLANSAPEIRSNVNVVSGNNYVLTFYYKLNSNPNNATNCVCGCFFLSTTNVCYVNVINNEFANLFSGTGSIEEVEDSWFKVTYKFTATANSSQVRNYFDRDIEGGIGTSVSFFGFQLEEGDYSTSYIPTAGTTVTRLDDEFSGFGDVGTFNDSEGTLFLEVKALDILQGGSFIGINDGTFNNQIYFSYAYASAPYEVFNVGVETGGVLQFNESINTLSFKGGYLKIAIIYSSSEISLFFNGSKIYTYTDPFTLPTGLSQLIFKGGQFPVGSRFLGKTKCIKYYPVAKTDDELEILTS